MIQTCFAIAIPSPRGSSPIPQTRKPPKPIAQRVPAVIPRHTEPIVERRVAARRTERQRVPRGTLPPLARPRGDRRAGGGFGGKRGQKNRVAKMIEVGERDVQRIAGKEPNGGLRVHVLREKLRYPAVLVENAGDVEGSESQSVGGVVATAADEIGARALGLGWKQGKRGTRGVSQASQTK